MVMVIKNGFKYLNQPISIAPLVIFRIAFGLLMFVSISRFIAKGWVNAMYVEPKMYFPYFGFEWVKPLSENGMYIVFGLLLFSSLGILLGFVYRFSAILFFILFTYVELIDKTNYLNHYYFVSLISFLLVFLPCAKAFSLDNKLFNQQETKKITRFYIFIIQLQMFAVYFFAGVAKINYDWLFNALPLKIWLPAFSHYPIIGDFMEAKWVAYLFAWFGCMYDLSIGFFLFNKRTVNIAYVFVIIFHSATALFFNIGMFPYIMMVITIIFFKEEFHIRILNGLKKVTRYSANSNANMVSPLKTGLLFLFSIYFFIQLLMPFRYLLYQGKLFWTEQGYRFSWRVMLMEKAGTAFFFVSDEVSGKEVEVDNKKHLTFMQEKMMATQPDMMVDYAKYLKQEYLKLGFKNPKVRAEAYVTLNGEGSKPFVNSQVDLSAESNAFWKNKNWIKEY